MTLTNMADNAPGANTPTETPADIPSRDDILKMIGESDPDNSDNPSGRNAGGEDNKPVDTEGQKPDESKKADANADAKADANADAKADANADAKADANADAKAEDKDNQGKKPGDKDAERYDRNWKKFQEDKKRFRDEQERVKKDLDELESLRREKFSTKRNTEAEEYERLAQEFSDEGNENASRVAKQKASEIRASAFKDEQEARTKRFISEWNQNYEKVAEANPELYDDESPLYKAVSGLLHSEKFLTQIPDGIAKAVDYVKAVQSRSQVTTLEAKVAELTARNQELTKKLSLGGELPSVPSGEKSFDDMNPKEQRAHLLRQARAMED